MNSFNGLFKSLKFFNGKDSMFCVKYANNYKVTNKDMAN